MALFFILSELCFKISFVPLKTNQFRQVSLYRFVIGHFLLSVPERVSSVCLSNSLRKVVPAKASVFKSLFVCFTVIYRNLKDFLNHLHFPLQA